VQNFQSVGFGGVVRKSKGNGFIGPFAEVTPADPCSCGGASVIAKAETFGDFYEVWGSAQFEARSSCACLQIGMTRRSRHELTFSNLSPKYGAEEYRTSTAIDGQKVQ